MELINKKALWEKVAELEEMARDRYLASPNCLPNGGVNPSAVRYGAQMDERTAFKHMIADAPTVDAVPVIRCRDCKKNDTSSCGMAYWDTETDEIIAWNKPYEFCSRAVRKEE